MSLDEEIILLEEDLNLELRRRGYAVAERHGGADRRHRRHGKPGFILPTIEEEVDFFETLPHRGALSDDPERSASLKQALEGLSAEAREVVEIVLDCPRELIEFVMGKGTNRELTGATLQAWLRWKGWKWRVIWAAFREVKKLLATL